MKFVNKPVLYIVVIIFHTNIKINFEKLKIIDNTYLVSLWNLVVDGLLSITKYYT